MWAAWLALGCYLIILVGVAVWARRGMNKDDDSYFLANRSLAWPMLLVTMAATNRYDCLDEALVRPGAKHQHRHRHTHP